MFKFLCCASLYLGVKKGGRGDVLGEVVGLLCSRVVGRIGYGSVCGEVILVG